MNGKKLNTEKSETKENKRVKEGSKLAPKVVSLSEFQKWNL